MFILFDAGGTKLRIASTINKKKLKEIKILKSPRNLNGALKLIERTALELAGSRKIKAIAGGITGVLDNSRGKKTENALKNKLKVPVFVNNDSAVVGLGEAHFGAGQGFSIVQYITVSTGVGGARIADGRIEKSTFGFEPGHQFIRFSGRKRESLEDLVSGKATQKKYKKPPKEVKGKAVWEDLSYKLALGVYNSMLHWSPEVIVLGGSMITGDPAIPVERVRKHLNSIKNLERLSKLPPVKKAALGDLGGFYGSLILLKQNKK